MKKIFTSILTVGISMGLVFASGVENKSNLSGGYLRNPSRNTENTRPEAAFYNIAGTAFMEDGFYLEAGNQFVLKKYSNELKTDNAYAGYGINDYKSTDDTTVILYPDFDVVYKKNRFSLFGTFGIYAGGGHLAFDNGTSATTLMFLQGAGKYKEAAFNNTLAAGAAEAKLTSGLATVKAGIAASQGRDVSDISDEVAWGYIEQKAESDPDLKNLWYIKNNQLMEKANNAASENGKIANASIAMAQKHSLDVTSITYGGQIGIAYRPLEWLSLSGAYRYTYGTQEMILKCNADAFKAINKSNKISYEAYGYGQSMVFGVHAKPEQVDGLDVSIQYQTLSRIDYDVENVKGDVAQYYDITNDKVFRTDLPAVLNFGVGYKVLESLYLSTSFNYYFNDFAHQDNILATTDYDNSWEVAFGVDWRICKLIGFSTGISYGKQGITDTSNSTFNPVLDNCVIGGGFEIYPTQNLTVTLSCLYANYFDADYYLGGTKSSSTKTVLSKEVTNMAFGVTYKFPVK